MSNKIKFPKLSKVEYLDIIKNKSVVHSFKPNDLEGLTWRQTQLLLGTILPPGLYNYTLKFIDVNSVNKGTIRSVSNIPAAVIKSESSQIEKQIDLLQQKVNALGSGSSQIGIDVLLSITKQSYETQITFLNNEINKKDLVINKLETKIDSLTDDLDNASELVEDLKQKTGIGQYLEIAQTFLKAKIGNLKPISNLKDSDPGDIPEEILLTIGLVDWQKVDANLLSEIINYLKIFIQKLPLKGN
jgi:hypothetical protein